MFVLYLIALWLVLFVFFMFIAIAINYYRELKLISILTEEGDPERYLTGIEKIINKIKKERYKDFYRVNKSAGLINAGRFDEAYGLLKAIDPDTLPTKINVLYYNNLLCILIALDKKDEAMELMNTKERIFETGIKEYSVLKLGIQSTLATYEFYMGNLDKSKSLFLALLNQRLKKVPFADTNYYLGLIYLKQGETENAKTKLNIALKNAGSTYIKEECEKVLQEITR